VFYGPEQALIHHRDFGKLAGFAAALLRSTLAEDGLTSGTVVDLGCGSGILARAMTDAGYDVVGFDLSPAMIALAEENAPKARFQVGSLHGAELPPCVAVAATGEALNYAADPRAGIDALRALIGRVRAALEPGGVFLFDVSTPGRGGPTGVKEQFHDREDWSLSMRAEESEDGSTLDRRITIFQREANGTYRRIDEHHVLRLYEADAIEEVIRSHGFEVAVSDDYVPDRKPLVGWKVFRAIVPGAG